MPSTSTNRAKTLTFEDLTYSPKECDILIEGKVCALTACIADLVSSRQFGAAYQVAYELLHTLDKRLEG